MSTLTAPAKKQETELPGKPKSDFYWAVKGAIRIAPSFIVLAVIATTVVYLAGIPATERAIAALIPTVVLFLIFRALMIVIPEPPKDARLKRPAATLFILIVVMFFSALATVDLILSSGIFALLGFPNLATGAVNVAFRGGLICTVSLVLALIDVLHSLGVDLTELVALLVWKVLGYPSRLAKLLFAPQW
jgi:hypothetical protein